ncbi:MAG: hypothetical protein ACRBBR_10300 [Cellvibrionaceae bacterium]
MGIMTSGVKQWVFQRIANALFVSFGICLLCVFLSTDGLAYESIKTEIVAWKWYFIIVLIFACINSILAGWQIDGDYAKKFGLPSNIVITLGAVLVSLLFLFYGLGLLFAL